MHLFFGYFKLHFSFIFFHRILDIFGILNEIMKRNFCFPLKFNSYDYHLRHIYTPKHDDEHAYNLSTCSFKQASSKVFGKWKLQVNFYLLRGIFFAYIVILVSTQTRRYRCYRRSKNFHAPRKLALYATCLYVEIFRLLW